MKNMELGVPPWKSQGQMSSGKAIKGEFQTTLNPGHGKPVIFFTFKTDIKIVLSQIEQYGS